MILTWLLYELFSVWLMIMYVTNFDRIYKFINQYLMSKNNTPTFIRLVF